MHLHKLKDYLQAELKEMRQLKEVETQKIGMPMDNNTAALLWIKDHADSFRQQWVEQKNKD